MAKCPVCGAPMSSNVYDYCGYKEKVKEADNQMNVHSNVYHTTIIHEYRTYESASKKRGYQILIGDNPNT